MGIDLALLFAVALSYLALLFVIAWTADSGWLPDRLVHSPLVFSLSLGVYATSWTYYGSVGLADRSGFAFLTIYLGLTGAFILGPYILRPVLRLCREHQLTSLADLLAFRYGGRATGFTVTLFMLVGILPYISLQIRAVTESIQILSRQVPPNLLALIFCIVITVFAILFGARHLTPREKHRGLVVAIAFESAVKLIALLIAGLFVVTRVFDSPAAMNEWARNQPQMLDALYSPATSGLWPTLLLLAFCAAFTLPRQYHMTFAENQDPRHLDTAYWLFPLYLLLLNLPIIPILFAGRHLSLSMAPDFYVLGMTLTLGREWLAILVFIGGLSAASAMMIVTTLALSAMCVNHFLLPATLASNQPRNFYRGLLWGRRMIIALIIAAGYGFYIIIELTEGLASLGLISFVAAAQLLPGILGLLFWPRATQAGFLAGLTAGALAWFVLLILPLVNPAVAPLDWFALDTDIWTLSTFCTLSVNGALFILGSLLGQPSVEEQAAAQAANEQAGLSSAGATIARSVLHYRYALQQSLGNKVAQDELDRALLETGVDENETRRSELRNLHDRLERNLTGLLGPTLAREILHRQPGTRDGLLSNTPDARLLERRLVASREQMRGLTKQLDDLRQYLQDVLRQLPLGVCSISSSGQIYIWNSAMQILTGIDERDAYEKSLDELEVPWGTLLADFARSAENHQFRCRAMRSNRPATVNLHKADISSDIGMRSGRDESLAGQVILMEDRTDLDTLETELAHSERLASVGRLAAGVAHEIGNPLTGIASIAQNLHHELHSSDEQSLVREQTDDILTQVGRINSIVRSLLTFSHADAVADTPHEPVNLTDRVNEALRLVTLSPDTRRLFFDISMPDSVLVLGDGNLLMQVFVNLINNACDASPDGATVSVHGTIQEDTLVVETIDEGSGIEPAVREQIFEPFFTTKPVGQGTGLGLSLAYSIIANHGGRLRIGDSDRGTRMMVTLPVHSATI
ncbi:MAG: histidine kinase [Granulosicoccus sp.]|nr:histidine kinase [Granulosicoccus sp.]